MKHSADAPESAAAETASCSCGHTVPSRMEARPAADIRRDRQVEREGARGQRQLRILLGPVVRWNSLEVAMAPGPEMLAPKCLIENVNEQLSVNQEALQILGEISNPVVVVAIVGLYRTGKSYLMNRLAGQNTGFSLGSTVQSETKGIWMWCVPHPTKPDCTLVLLDTEGLGDVEKGDPKNDSWIFALAVLLSSTFVYNNMNTINHQALEQLQYVTELTQLIRAKSSSTSNGVKDATEFVSFFPSFIWTVRDFTLELKLGGQPITADQYLENALKLIPGDNPRAQISNLPRECIRNFFPHRKCFVFDRPTNDKHDLHNIENISEDQLDPKFQEQTHSFCSYIFNNANIKTLKEGIVVTGNRLGALVETYMKAISSGAVPCLENAVTTLAQRENAAAVQKAVNHYREQMAQRVQLPTDTLQELLDVHTACEKEAIAVFMEGSFKDEDGKFQKQMKTIQEMKEDFLLKNEEKSDQYCQEKLNLLSKDLKQSVSAGSFCVSGGHQLYMEMRKKIEEGYFQVPRKGVKAGEVLQSFLQSQAAIEKIILQSDKALTDREKTMAEEKAKKEAAERAQEISTEKEQVEQQLKAALQRTLKENMEHLEKKLLLESENRLREQKMMLEKLHKIKMDLLEEGFNMKAEAISEELKHLQSVVEASESDDDPYITQALNSVGEGITAVLSAPGKVLGNVVKSIGHLFK
ncbi:PREDICTED: guanylate-binding protein 6-like isoform X2 [Chinchilla lanigera]|uniref:guanylate-binding protein 6-like isoform X2 n=1 Tax=Chinchilla lanigera TaxID=34839 RepID=UPI00038E9BAD|nr:PREDICTED: guanylate-binding protein 6-like isoform X2 [Chinchilla lanigera]